MMYRWLPMNSKTLQYWMWSISRNEDVNILNNSGLEDTGVL